MKRNLTQKAFLGLCLMALSTMSATAETVTAYVNKVQYDFDTEAKTAKIVGLLNSVTDLVIDATVTYNDEEYTVWIPAYCFNGDSQLESVTVNAPIDIPTYAFTYCSKLKSLKFSAEVKSLAYYSCCYNSNLTDVQLNQKIFSGTTNIQVLSSCGSIENITLADEGSYAKLIDGCLYVHDMLYLAPSATTKVTLPYTATGIWSYALSKTSVPNLQEVVLSEHCESPTDTRNAFVGQSGYTLWTFAPYATLFAKSSYITGTGGNVKWYGSAREKTGTLPTYDKAVVYKLKNRTLTADSWNGICVPFDVPGSQIEDMFGEGTKVMAFGGKSDGNVLNFTSSTNMEAGKAYLIKPANTVESPVFEAVTVTAGDPVAVEGDYGLQGTYDLQTAMKTDGTNRQVTADGAMEKFGTGYEENRMLGYNAYLVVPEADAETTFTVNFDGKPTAISGLAVKAAEKTYNLQGQTVAKPTAPGIYIKGGKKVVVK